MEAFELSSSCSVGVILALWLGRLCCFTIRLESELKEVLGWIYPQGLFFRGQSGFSRWGFTLAPAFTRDGENHNQSCRDQGRKSVIRGHAGWRL